MMRRLCVSAQFMHGRRSTGQRASAASDAKVEMLAADAVAQWHCRARELD